MKKKRLITILLLAAIILTVGALAYKSLNIDTAKSRIAENQSSPAPSLRDKSLTKQPAKKEISIEKKAAAEEPTPTSTPEIVPEETEKQHELSKKDRESESGNEEVQKAETGEGLETRLERMISKYGGVYSVSVKNLKSGEEVYINPVKMPSASVIKIFIMIEAYNQINQGKINPDEKIAITRDMKVGGTGSLQGVKDGTAKAIRQLVELMITESDNTATNILIERLNMGSINSTIKNLGCADTVLQRKMMDMESIKAGRDNFTSVGDLVLVLEKLYRGECLGGSADKDMLGIMKRQKSNTKIPGLLPKGTVVAHKTGELGGIENDAGIVYGSRGAYIIAIQTKGLPDSSAGAANIAAISKAVYDYMANN